MNSDRQDREFQARFPSIGAGLASSTGAGWTSAGGRLHRILRFFTCGLRPGRTLWDAHDFMRFRIVESILQFLPTFSPAAPPCLPPIGTNPVDIRPMMLSLPRPLRCRDLGYLSKKKQRPCSCRGYMLRVSRGVEESSSCPRYERTGRAIVVQNHGVIRPS